MFLVKKLSKFTNIRPNNCINSNNYVLILKMHHAGFLTGSKQHDLNSYYGK